LWQTGAFYTSFYHKIIDDYYTRVYIQDPSHTEISIKAYDNLGRATNTGIELGFDQKIIKEWKVTASTNIYSNTIFEHEGQIMFPEEQSYIIAKRIDMPVYLKMTNQLTIGNDFIFELTAQYFSKKNIGQGNELSRGGLDFGMKKKFFGSKLEINLTASDIFNTMGLRQRIKAEGFIVEYQNFYETQIFLLALKYRF
jgi:hypothetical protein